MIVEFDKSFSKSLSKIKEPSVLKRVKSAIIKLEKADKIEEISSIKKLRGFNSYYRIKIGDHRIGFEKKESKIVVLIIVEHRKDIYKIFP